jgi:beta-lactamase class A
MKLSRREWLLLLTAAPSTFAIPPALTDKWREIASRIDGTVGIAARHLTSGATFNLNGDEKFPMASVCKLPLAMNILALVDEGRFQIDQMIDIPEQDIFPSVSVVAERWPKQKRFKLSDLVAWMVAQSDNTCVETLLRIGGGPPAMAKRFQQWGVSGIRIDRSERECLLHAAGVTTMPKYEEWTPKLYGELTSKIPPSKRLVSLKAFVSDPRDTATPDGTVDLLRKLWDGKLLSAASTARLMRILESTTTGPARLKGALPQGTVVAHKTGTNGTVQGFNAGTNDVGIVTLPGKAGRFAIAVFIKSSSRPASAIERTIAQIARAAYDEW